ncbi:MAG: hypothetical protein R3268_00155 [Acidiferrobacterales bacterium]|nr:hypothetical protein [Acidiferrobacterales bacterium]
MLGDWRFYVTLGSALIGGFLWLIEPVRSWLAIAVDIPRYYLGVAFFAGILLSVGILWPRARRVPVTEGKHDVWLLDAIKYVAFGSWDVSIGMEADHFSSVHDAEVRVIQAAVDGDLPVWGKKGFSGPLLSIPAEYWEFYGLEWRNILADQPGELTTEQKVHGQIHGDGVRRELKTSKAVVERLFS